MTNRVFSEYVIHIPIFEPPLEIDWNKRVTNDFKLKEYRDALGLVPDEWKELVAIPIDWRLRDAIQVVRDYLGSEVVIKSLFRSVAFNHSKRRYYQSTHEHAMAGDLAGKGVREMIYEAVKSKNQLYKALRALNINSFGFYSWGVHIDTRDRKTNNKDRIWFENENVEKKLTSSVAVVKKKRLHQ